MQINKTKGYLIEVYPFTKFLFLSINYCTRLGKTIYLEEGKNEKN